MVLDVVKWRIFVVGGIGELVLVFRMVERAEPSVAEWITEYNSQTPHSRLLFPRRFLFFQLLNALKDFELVK